jgi:uncharacterized protein (TIGR04255 family)
MSLKKLPYAPLQEVIFEGKWELSLDTQTKAFIDPELQFALGKFKQSISQTFPVYKSKFPPDIPQQLLTHQPIHQFWTGEGVWPVLQLGPGIVTVNDTAKNYEWENVFFPLVKETLGNVRKAYDNEMNFILYTLRYIDVVNIQDYAFKNWQEFVMENINFQFKNGFATPGTLNNFRFEQAFEIPGIGLLEISLSNGQNNKKEDIFVWQTAVSGRNSINCDGLIDWLVDAHNNCSGIFKEICKEKFYGSFINR